MKQTHERILAALQANPGLTYRALARRVGLPLGTTYDQVTAMRKLGLLMYGSCPTCGRLIHVKGDADGNEAAGFQQDHGTGT